LAEKKDENTEKIKLSPKRETFCQEYIVDSNGTKAAIRAGYAKRSAEQQASSLMLNHKVKARIIHLTAKKLKRQEKSADDVILKLWTILNFDPKKFIEITQKDIKTTDYEGKTSTEPKSFIEITDWENIPGELISSIKLDKNSNPVITFVSKETALRLLKDIYFDTNRETGETKDIEMTYDNKPAADHITAFKKKKGLL